MLVAAAIVRRRRNRTLYYPPSLFSVRSFAHHQNLILAEKGGRKINHCFTYTLSLLFLALHAELACDFLERSVVVLPCRSGDESDIRLFSLMDEEEEATVLFKGKRGEERLEKRRGGKTHSPCPRMFGFFPNSIHLV